MSINSKLAVSDKVKKRVKAISAAIKFEEFAH